MNSKSISTTRIILELEHEEARWLKQVVQNPIGVDKDDEDISDEEMRQRFWKALETV